MHARLSRSAAEKASTASRGLLPSKGDERRQATQSGVLGVVHRRGELASVPAAQELLTRDAELSAGLLVEEGAALRVVEPSNRGAARLRRERHGPLLSTL